MKRLALAVYAISCALVGCVSGGEVFPPMPPKPVDGVDCDAAQRRLEALGCAWAKSPKGVPFATACRDVAAAGIDIAPQCVARANSCGEAAECRP